MFDIEDFSLATPYERFVRSLEERCREWGLDRGGLGRRSFESCELLYAERSFQLRAHSAQPGCAAPEPPLYLPGRGGEEEADQEGLSTWLGLHSFLLLAPSTARKVSRHEAGLLLSALTLAAAAAQVCLPLLVKVGEPRKRELWGRSSTGSACTLLIPLRGAARLLPAVLPRLTRCSPPSAASAPPPCSVGFRYDVRTSLSVPPSIRYLDGVLDFFNQQRVH